MTDAPSGKEIVPAFVPSEVRYPDRSLLYYYCLVSLFAGPFFPMILVPLFFKYETLEYKLDESGISMRWGILFRQEIYLTYRRIQDIHLTRNIVQRWLGLATVSVQTAAGSMGAEMAIEGILQADELRDFLYGKMRGARGELEGQTTLAPCEGGHDEALTLLREIRDSVRQLAGGK